MRQPRSGGLIMSQRDVGVVDSSTKTVILLSVEEGSSGVRLAALGDKAAQLRLPMKLIQQSPPPQICSAMATDKGTGRIDTARLTTTSM